MTYINSYKSTCIHNLFEQKTVKDQKMHQLLTWNLIKERNVILYTFMSDIDLLHLTTQNKTFLAIEEGSVQ